MVKIQKLEEREGKIYAQAYVLEEKEVSYEDVIENYVNGFGKLNNVIAEIESLQEKADEYEDTLDVLRPVLIAKGYFGEDKSKELEENE